MPAVSRRGSSLRSDSNGADENELIRPRTSEICASWAAPVDGTMYAIRAIRPVQAAAARPQAPPWPMTWRAIEPAATIRLSSSSSSNVIIQ